MGPSERPERSIASGAFLAVSNPAIVARPPLAVVCTTLTPEVRIGAARSGYPLTGHVRVVIVAVGEGIDVCLQAPKKTDQILSDSLGNGGPILEKNSPSDGT